MNRIHRINAWLALRITRGVGTMACAYLFIALASVSLPAALKTGDKIVIVSWIAQTFFQLVLLPIIMVGQSFQAQQTIALQGAHNDLHAKVDAVHEHLGIPTTTP